MINGKHFSFFFFQVSKEVSDSGFGKTAKVGGKSNSVGLRECSQRSVYPNDRAGHPAS